MKKKSVSAVIIIALLMMMPLVISPVADDTPYNISIRKTVKLKKQLEVITHIPPTPRAFSILIEFVNNGTVPVTDISVFGEIQKIVGVVIIGDIFTASIASILPGERVTLQTQMQFGIGLMNYNVSASSGPYTISYDRNYLLIGVLIIPL